MEEHLEIADNEIIQFIDNRPGLNILKILNFAGIEFDEFVDFEQGVKPLSNEHRDNLVIVLMDYGFDVTAEEEKSLDEAGLNERYERKFKLCREIRTAGKYPFLNL